LAAIRRLVDTVAPDIIHSHFVTTTLALRLALGRHHPVPRLFQVPGPLHLEHALFRAADLYTAGPADRWIASCHWTANRYRRSGIDPSRIFFAYYGVDCEEFSPQPRGKLRQELGLEPETPVIGMVAYVYAPKRYLGQRRGLKGHEDLIDAMVKVLAVRPDAVCAMVGGPWQGADAYAHRLRQYAEARCGNHVRFLGTRHDVAALYADFDVVVHPSHSENLGGAAESLLLGVPTIATDVGGFPDIVRPGETGWLVPARRPDRLATTILEVLGGRAEARRRADRGRGLAREVLDVKVTAAAVARIYERVVGATGSSRADRPTPLQPESISC
jgi:glycosyltransferase involved in cell wall biosynthesis